MQLDVTKGTRFIHWIVFNKDGLYKTETVKLDVAGAPLIETPPTLLDTVIGQVTTCVGQEGSKSVMSGWLVRLFEAVQQGQQRPGSAVYNGRWLWHLVHCLPPNYDERLGI